MQILRYDGENGILGLYDKMNTPPIDESDLQERAIALAGRSLGEIALSLGEEVPQSSLHAKGWAGQLVEKCLGADSGSLSEPDFRHLGIELKTLPITSAGQPKESTYVSVVPLKTIGHMHWTASSVYKKLKKVLWVPIVSDKKLKVAERTIGYPFIWTMDAKTEQVIRQDWEEFAELICVGQVDTITAHQGTWLQIRPKAAHARVRSQGVGETGDWVKTLPRGFYLRPSFTRQLLQAFFDDK